MSSAPTPRSPDSSSSTLAAPEPEKDAVQTQLEDGPARGLAYAARLRTFITATSRYVAYTSDIGEAFRPLVTPAAVRAAYAISWLYLGGDVSYAGYRTWKTGAGHHQAHPATSAIDGPSTASSSSSSSSAALPDRDELRKRLQGINSTQDAKHAASALSSEVSQALTPAGGAASATDIGFVMARRAVFQALASMMLPAFTIHSIVRYSAPLFARSASKRLASLGPTISGLAAVPALPFLFDHPVEQAVDVVFDKIEEVVLHKEETNAVPEEKKNA